MAFTSKYTAQRGKHTLADVARTAGAAEAQTDTISINVDITNMPKGEALLLIDAIVAAIHADKWPPV